MERHNLLARSIFVITLLYICGLCATNGQDADENILTREQKTSSTETALRARSEQQEDEISEDTILLVEELKKRIDERLELQRKELEEVAINAKANGRKITFHFSIVSLFACGVIAVSGLVLGLGAYRSYVDNRQILGRMEKKLDREFGPWLDSKEKECKEMIEQLYNEYKSDSQQFLQFVRLKFIIDQPGPEADEVYPLLTPLSSNPRLEYKPLFVKIIDLNIHPEITAKAQEGLNKL